VHVSLWGYIESVHTMFMSASCDMGCMVYGWILDCSMMDVHLWKWLTLELLDLVWMLFGFLPWSVGDIGMTWCDIIHHIGHMEVGCFCWNYDHISFINMIITSEVKHYTPWCSLTLRNYTMKHQHVNKQRDKRHKIYLGKTRTREKTQQTSFV